MPDSKYCAGCKRVKALNLFNTDTSRLDKHTSKCAECCYKINISRITPTTQNGLKRRIKAPERYKWCGGYSAMGNADAAHLALLTQFSNSSRTPDGLDKVCKDCNKARYQASQLRKKTTNQ